MKALIAVRGCTLQFLSGKGVVTIKTEPSKTSLIDNKGIYSGSINFTVTNYVGNGILDGDGTGEGVINGSSKDTFVDGKSVLKQGDSVVVTLTGSAAGVFPIVITDVLQVIEAGQISVLTE